MQAYADDGWFMGSVLIAQNGKVVLSKGYGWADAEWSIPNSEFPLDAIRNRLDHKGIHCSFDLVARRARKTED
jgi:hypothetical protein